MLLKGFTHFFNARVIIPVFHVVYSLHLSLQRLQGILLSFWGILDRKEIPNPSGPVPTTTRTPTSQAVNIHYPASLVLKHEDLKNSKTFMLLWIQTLSASIICLAGEDNQTSTPVSNNTVSNNGKRRRTQGAYANGYSDCGDDEWPNDEQEAAGNSDDGHQGNSGEPKKPSNSLWACPFYKLDPHRHSRCREKFRLRRYPDVKQHIIRYHAVENHYYCARCLTNWQSKPPWERHMNRGSYQPSASAVTEDTSRLERFLEHEVDLLKKTPTGLTDHEKWYYVWKTFFEGYDAPASPFVEDSNIETVSLFCTAAKSALTAQLPSLLLQSFNIQVDEASVLPFRNAILRVMTESFESQPPRFREPNRASLVAARILPAVSMSPTHNDGQSTSPIFENTMAPLSSTGAQYVYNPGRPNALPTGFLAASYMSPTSRTAIPIGEALTAATSSINLALNNGPSLAMPAPLGTLGSQAIRPVNRLAQPLANASAFSFHGTVNPADLGILQEDETTQGAATEPSTYGEHPGPDQFRWSQ